MNVQVVKLKENGKRLQKEHPPEPLSGDLELVNYQNAGRGYACLTLTQTFDTGMRQIAGHLLEPRLVGLSGGCMLLEGFERGTQGQAFHQCWKVLLG